MIASNRRLGAKMSATKPSGRVQEVTPTHPPPIALPSYCSVLSAAAIAVIWFCFFCNMSVP